MVPRTPRKKRAIRVMGTMPGTSDRSILSRGHFGHEASRVTARVLLTHALQDPRADRVLDHLVALETEDDHEAGARTAPTKKPPRRKRIEVEPLKE
jgi:hypothetical protein